MMNDTRRLYRLFQYCNLFCELAECNKYESSKSLGTARKWMRFGVTRATKILPKISSSLCCCVVSFMNVSTLLECWFIIYLFLASRNADVTIFYSCKVLKTFNHHLNHKCKFTIIIGKTSRDHF